MQVYTVKEIFATKNCRSIVYTVTWKKQCNNQTQVKRSNLRRAIPCLLMDDTCFSVMVINKVCLRLASAIFSLGRIPGQYTAICSLALVVAVDRTTKPLPLSFSAKPSHLEQRITGFPLLFVSLMSNIWATFFQVESKLTLLTTMLRCPDVFARL